MAKNLVIVESPAKVKTIKKFLGASYEVDASNGHVRDLPKSTLGVDVDGDYDPKYITIRGKGDILLRLRREAKKADRIYLATDPDREGEAISWHLSKALKLDEYKDKKVYRISFNEITKKAVKEALKNPREIDMSLVDAQQTRRILDRMVGYTISPLLWDKVKRGLSAGRVQSVALRMICDRDRQISDFIPREYWTIDAFLEVAGSRKKLEARLAQKNGEKTDISSAAQKDEILKDLEGADFIADSVKEGERIRRQPLPFTTSTMQQEASRALGFSPQKTMRIAQQLYEGVDVEGHGTIGLITYLRTDSTRVADEAQTAAAEYIENVYGKEYVAKGTSGKKSAAKIQDAHEAIRPTDITLSPSVLKDLLPREQLRLYQLIWRRFTASAMSPAVYKTTQIRIRAGVYTFLASASKRIFDGFMSVYTSAEDDEDKTSTAPVPEEKAVLKASSMEAEQHFTQPPAHYTEASLIKELEECGIGRPSTYAPTITTILARHYVEKEKKNLYATELGEAVCMIMKDCFPTIVDTAFTANMEQLLDGVGDGAIDWKDILRNFYPDLAKTVKAAQESLKAVKLTDEETDIPCDVCGRKLVIKYGPHGKFLACPGFPECRFTKPLLEKTGITCPECGREIVVRKTRHGRRYFGCEGAPECGFMSWQKPSQKKCPRCGGYMLEKGNYLVCHSRECGYTEKTER